MKKLFYKILGVTVITFFSLATVAQGIQSTFNYTGNVISFKVRPTLDITTGFSVIEFFVRVPDATPAFTWGSITPNATNFPGVGTVAPSAWARETVTGIPGFRVDHFFYTAPAPITTTRLYSGGVEYEVFTVQVIGAPDLGALGMQMVHSPGDEDPYYVALTDQIGGDLRPGVVPTFFFPSPDVAGDPHFLNLNLVAAPAFFQDFNVTKQGSSTALLNWTTSQEQNVSHFVVERSLSQTSGWTKAGEVKAKGNSNTPTKYTLTDLNVYDGRAASQTIYYRIRAIDYDGAEKIFPIRSVRFSVTSKDITIYPNPVKDGFYIQIPLENPRGTNKIKLQILSRTGSVLQSREINATMASNYYYDLKSANIIPGEYMVQVIYGDELLDTKKIVVQR